MNELDELLAYLGAADKYKQTKVFKDKFSTNPEKYSELICEAIQITLTDGSPMSKLLALRLSKEMVETRERVFLEEFQVRILPKMRTIASFKSDDPSDVRGKYLFSPEPSKELAQIGNSVFKLTLDCIRVWATWFPGTKFQELYASLKCSFPKLSYYKDSDLQLEKIRSSLADAIQKAKDLLKKIQAELEYIGDLLSGEGSDEEIGMLGESVDLLEQYRHQIENILMEIIDSDQENLITELITKQDFFASFIQDFTSFKQDRLSLKALKQKYNQICSATPNPDWQTPGGDSKPSKYQQVQKLQSIQEDPNEFKMMSSIQQSSIQQSNQSKVVEQKSEIAQSQQNKEKDRLNQLQQENLKKQENERQIQEQIQQQKQKEELQRQEQIKQEQLRKDQIKQEEIKQELLKQQQIKLEQAKQEQIKQEQLKQEQLKQEQMKQEQIKQEQIKQEQIKQEQIKQDQIKQNQLKQQQITEEQIKSKKQLESQAENQKYQVDQEQQIKQKTINQSVNEQPIQKSFKQTPTLQENDLFEFDGTQPKGYQQQSTILQANQINSQTIEVVKQSTLSQIAPQQKTKSEYVRSQSQQLDKNHGNRLEYNQTLKIENLKQDPELNVYVQGGMDFQDYLKGQELIGNKKKEDSQRSDTYQYQQKPKNEIDINRQPTVYNLENLTPLSQISEPHINQIQDSVSVVKYQKPLRSNIIINNSRSNKQETIESVEDEANVFQVNESINNKMQGATLQQLQQSRRSRSIQQSRAQDLESIQSNRFQEQPSNRFQEQQFTLQASGHFQTIQAPPHSNRNELLLLREEISQLKYQNQNMSMTYAKRQKEQNQKLEALYKEKQELLDQVLNLKLQGKDNTQVTNIIYEKQKVEIDCQSIQYQYSQLQKEYTKTQDQYRKLQEIVKEKDKLIDYLQQQLKDAKLETFSIADVEHKRSESAGTRTDTSFHNHRRRTPPRQKLTENQKYLIFPFSDPLDYYEDRNQGFKGRLSHQSWISNQDEISRSLLSMAILNKSSILFDNQYVKIGSQYRVNNSNLHLTLYFFNQNKLAQMQIEGLIHIGSEISCDTPRSFQIIIDKDGNEIFNIVCKFPKICFGMSQLSLKISVNNKTINECIILPITVYPFCKFHRIAAKEFMAQWKALQRTELFDYNLNLLPEVEKITQYFNVVELNTHKKEEFLVGIDEIKYGGLLKYFDFTYLVRFVLTPKQQMVIQINDTSQLSELILNNFVLALSI